VRKTVTDRYPLSVTDHRKLPSDYHGNVFVWDVDKTYLATKFSSFRNLLKIPLEFAVDKRSIPGMPEVLRGLRRGAGDGYACVPLYFVSASPPQLRPVLERKMLLDGVEYDGLIFKDWGKVLRGLQPRRLREQIGFKICALLTGRLLRPLATEFLFGDDVEVDALVYSLYAQSLAGDLSSRDLESTLRSHGVSEPDIRCALILVGELPSKLGTVKRIFIHLEKNSPPERFDPLGKRVAPVRGGFQLALAVFESGLVNKAVVQEAADALRKATSTPVDLDELVRDAIDRGLLSPDRARQVGW
jgi:hypothetical protein